MLFKPVQKTLKQYPVPLKKAERTEAGEKGRCMAHLSKDKDRCQSCLIREGAGSRINCPGRAPPLRGQVGGKGRCVGSGPVIHKP